jgi:hypothetical protein
MGGAFTDYVSWRWCFYINLPLGVVTALFIIFFFKTPARRKTQATFMQQLQQLDLEGTMFFPPAIICLLLALRWSGTKYEWKDARVIILFVLFGILITGFVAVQIWKQERATVPPRVLKDRNFWASAWFDASLSASFFIMVYCVSLVQSLSTFCISFHNFCLLPANTNLTWYLHLHIMIICPGKMYTVVCRD